MRTQTALNKARKILGRSADIRHTPEAPTKSARTALIAKHGPYGKAPAELRWQYHTHKCVVGKLVLGGMFFEHVGWGDTWQEALDMAVGKVKESV